MLELAAQPFASSVSGLLLVGLALVAIPAGAGALWKLLKQGSVAVQAVAQAQAQLAAVDRRMDDQDDVLDEIKHEIRTNGGGSLKDAVVRTEDAVIRTERQAHLNGEETKKFGDRLTEHLIFSASKTAQIEAALHLPAPPAV